MGLILFFSLLRPKYELCLNITYVRYACSKMVYMSKQIKSPFAIFRTKVCIFAK